MTLLHGTKLELGMPSNQKEFLERTEKIKEGVGLAYLEMVRFKRSKNSPLIIMEDGKIVEKDPFSIPLPEDEDKGEK